VARFGRGVLARSPGYGCSRDFDFEPIGDKATKTIPAVQIQLDTEGVIGGAGKCAHDKVMQEKGKLSYC